MINVMTRKRMVMNQDKCEILADAGPSPYLTPDPELALEDQTRADEQNAKRDRCVAHRRIGQRDEGVVQDEAQRDSRYNWKDDVDQHIQFATRCREEESRDTDISHQIDEDIDNGRKSAKHEKRLIWGEESASHYANDKC